MAKQQNRSGSHQKPALGLRLARSQPGLAARVGLKGQGQDERPKAAGLDPSPRGGLIGPATGGSENQTGRGWRNAHPKRAYVAPAKRLLAILYRSRSNWPRCPPDRRNRVLTSTV
jgi:hypothetical protein